ncbi:MAG: hypothetical protein U9R58_09335, partial [Chloroflexota bacterium]|nr:hypothetical protein [Chloroflexota bacterium]
TACGKTTAEPEKLTTTPDTVEEPTLEVAPTVVTIPTPTESSEIVILLAPPGTEADNAADLQSVLEELSERDNLELQTVSQLSSSDINEDVRLVVVLPPDPGVRALATAAPHTQFLAVGIPGFEPTQNLSVLGALGEQPDRQGFLAGYMAATVTPEWRVGVISSEDTAPGKAAGNAFLNGAVFFCGLCRTASPPYYEYPQIYRLPAGAGDAQWSTAVDYMAGNAVQTVYVSPESMETELLQYLADSGINIIGSEAPPNTVRDNWVASIEVDWLTPLRALWPRLISGEGGAAEEVLLVITNQNPALFSPGRQRLVNELLVDLQDGYIGTGVDPLTGEPRY